ncbi:unnamed protein product [Urochloa humidicola]
MAPPPSSRSRPDTGSAALPLPVDASYEILLRFPAKDLCRLRAVSRAWRSLLSDPQFIAAHGARHPGPLIVSGHPISTGRRSDYLRFKIMDLSGRIVKRLHVAGEGTNNAADDVKISSQAGLVCILGDMGKRCRVLDPATGSVTSLPEGLAEEHAANQPGMGQYSAAVVCGKVASTGEHKVLRVLDIRLFSCFGSNPKPLCEVLTLDGSGNARWRGKKASPDPVSVYDETSRAVVDGCVYFFLNELAPLHIAGPKRIASFDLGMEEWRRTLKGPKIVGFVGNNARRRPRRGDVDYNYFSLAALNGCLAVVHCVGSSFMDLWFLMDFEQGLWVKRHSIQMKPSVGHDECSLRPLSVLNDGRVVVAFTGYSGFMRIYNPNGGTYINVAEISPHVGFDCTLETC